MIGKAGLGNYAKGILEYCYYEKNNLSERKREALTINDVRGELVYIQNLGLDFKPDGRLNIDYLSKQFVHNRENNKNLNKFVWHQTFSFPPEEKVKPETMRTICERFSEEFGFGDNQMVAFIHKDTAHQHFHIVANRVSGNGKNTADHFNNYRRTGDFCRKIELELGLSITPEMKQRENKEKVVSGVDFKAELLMEVPKAIKESKHFNEFTARMKKQGVKCDIGRGLTFIHAQTNQRVKGSDLSREYSLQNLKNQFVLVNTTAEQVKSVKKGLSL
ncbi:relaxase/mobilization nuclease domain-containing protein [Dyadobacter sediminis]|uniref:Relaxase n=1 Tax=Dyadobacter sediminis TaxID=1493691 RepID=A0A5R9KKH8_9BACT|nr:relaxase/mobilization nuclease domain-containing protein [Dyadobacter sediminis]TLU96556.1 relaxase [Dyadobacter sediminis]GGB83204.1 hypothetical protein GCM10011325_08440 [Dyadobacter sediminis]